MPCPGNDLRFRRRRSAAQGKAASDDEYARSILTNKTSSAKGRDVLGHSPDRGLCDPCPGCKPGLDSFITYLR